MTRRARTASITIRTEADVLALVPFTLGFVPEDSLVLLTLDQDGAPFQARVDLPPRPGLLPAAVAALVDPAVRNGGSRGLVVVYSDDPVLAQAAAWALHLSLRRAGIQTVVAIRADGQRWYPLRLADRGTRRGSLAAVHEVDPDSLDVVGVPYDLRSHPLTTRSVFEGRVTHGSRQELADSVARSDAEAAAVATAFRDLPALRPSLTSELVEEGRALVEEVRALLRSDDPVDAVDPASVARLLRGIAHRDVRDLLWCEITRFTADRHVVLWRAVVVRSPDALVAPAAGLLAFAAWLAGDGALAWCAVDRCLDADPGHMLGRLVSQALEEGLPPSAWRPVDPSTLPLAAT